MVKHIKAEQKRIGSSATKKSLLAEGDSSEDDAADEEYVPVWLILGTKKHVVDQKRLKPSKMYVYSITLGKSEEFILIHDTAFSLIPSIPRLQPAFVS